MFGGSACGGGSSSSSSVSSQPKDETLWTTDIYLEEENRLATTSPIASRSHHLDWPRTYRDWDTTTAPRKRLHLPHNTSRLISKHFSPPPQHPNRPYCISTHNIKASYQRLSYGGRITIQDNTVLGLVASYLQPNSSSDSSAHTRLVVRLSTCHPQPQPPLNPHLSSLLPLFHMLL